MDDRRFDAAVRTLTRNGSRRAAAKAVAGSALAALVATFGRDEAAAKCVNPGKKCKGSNGKKKNCCDGAKCKGSKCQCPAGLEACGGLCVDTLSDLQDCGQCGNACGGAEICKYGTCCAKSGPSGPGIVCCSGINCNPPGENCVCI